MLDGPQSTDLQDESPYHITKEATRVPKQLNISKLKYDLVKEKLVEELDNRLPPPNTNPQVDVEAECVRFLMLST